MRCIHGRNTLSYTTEVSRFWHNLHRQIAAPEQSWLMSGDLLFRVFAIAAGTFTVAAVTVLLFAH